MGGGNQHDPEAERASLVFGLAAVTRPAEPGPDAAAINPHAEREKNKKKKKGSGEILQETKLRDYDEQLETSAWSDSRF